jgi:holo-[acyl-carrier protein] synthase
VIVGIGCDCIEIARIRQALARSGQRLLARLLTPRELDYCHQHQDPVFTVAGRFAGKEALAKALGVGIGSALSWQDMEIINDAHGKPFVVWHIDVRERFGIQATHLSLSHSHTIAIAYAVVEGA